MENSYLFFIGLILGLAIFIAYFVYLVLFCKNRSEKSLPKKEMTLFISLAFLQGLTTILSSYGCVLWGKWNLAIGEHMALVSGSYMFGTGFDLLLGSFILYYYKTSLNEGMHRLIQKILIISIPLLVIGFVTMTNGMADYVNLDHPLPNRISFTKGFVNAQQYDVGFAIPFYGILVVGGAVVSYFICDHKVYQKFHKHGLVDTLFIVAFIAGIIGGRLWSCLVLDFDKTMADPMRIFRIWEGGMAIQGGVLLGAIVGISFMLLFRKYINIRWAMDTFIPTILIAQVIGRFGNFFNLEVFGNPVSIEGWRFLPKIILNQLRFSVSGAALPADQIHLPLFAIEASINLAGYFIITKAIAIPLRKKLSLGDLSSLYVIWYGLVRISLELLRDAEFRYMQSWITAFVMVGVGVIGIIAAHLYDYYRKKKNLPPRTWETV